MYRALSAVAMLLIGLYCVGNALWRLGCTAWFVVEAQRVPATVVDETKRPFDGIFEQLRHGNMPWDGGTAFRPHMRYVLYGRPIVDADWPDLDNRRFVDGTQVTLLIHPQNPHQRHIDSPKFLWTGSCVLLLVGGFSLLTGWFLLKRREKTAVISRRVSRAPAVREMPANQEQSDLSSREGGETVAVSNHAEQDGAKKTVRRKRRKSEQANTPDSPPAKRKRKAPNERKNSGKRQAPPRKKSQAE